MSEKKEKRVLSQEQKNKMAFGRLIKMESKELIVKNKDDITVEKYNSLVNEVITMRESLKALISERETSDVKNAAIKEVTEAVIPNTKKEDKVDLPDVKKWVSPVWLRTSADLRTINLSYMTVSSEVTGELGKYWALEKWQTWRAVRYVENETVSARMAKLKSKGIKCRVNRGLTEEIAAYSEKSTLIKWYDSGFLVLSDKKKEQLWIK